MPPNSFGGVVTEREIWSHIEVGSKAAAGMLKMLDQWCPVEGVTVSRGLHMP